MHIEESKRVLRNTQLFQDLNDSHLDLVLMICEERNCRAGDVIFHQDDPGAALYIVARGEVEIYLEPERLGDEPVSLAVLGQNQTFGETILVEAGRRSAGARCHSDVQLLRIPRRQMVTLMSDYPEIGFRILRRMAADLTAKLRSANEQIRDRR